MIRDLIMAAAGADVVAVPSQVVFTSTLTTDTVTSWVVPEGVKSICVVAIGSGGGGASDSTSAYTASGGGGGALAYTNNIPVTPGETLTISLGKLGVRAISSGSAGTSGGDYSINQGGSTIILAKGGFGGANNGGTGGLSSESIGSVKYSGGTGGTGKTNGGVGDGGSAASYIGNGVAGSSNNTTGVGGSGIRNDSNIDTSATPPVSYDGGYGGTYGGGGGASKDGSNFGRGGNGGAGCIRIIWGAGRSYPSNALDV